MKPGSQLTQRIRQLGQAVPTQKSPMKHRWLSKLCCRLSALAAILLLNAAGNYTTNAADGPAPSSQQRRVVSGVHADAIAVFAENGGLTLGSKADVDGNLGVQLDPNLTAFNVEQSRKTTIPNGPSYAFLGTPGSEVWIAPESNPGAGALWPGFSTEGIPTGVLDGNQLTLRLEAVSGPGTLQVFQSDTFGNPVRRFSSTGTEFREWNLPRGTHAHANWAFSATGSYTLTFKATAVTNGVSISSTQNYTFVVGTVPAAVATTTTLAASTNSIVLGTAVTLNATVVPNNAVGYLEFRDGATILGHEANVNGSATLATTNLPLGTRSVTARFVPQWLNDFSASTSAPVSITVTDGSGETFGITGIAASYLPGDELIARAVGYTPREGDLFVWYIRPVGTSIDGFGEFGSNLDAALQGNLTLPLDAGLDGYELKVSVVDGNFVGTGIGSAWVPISVRPRPGVDPVLTQFPAGGHYNGDVLAFPIGRDLAPGETGRVVYRFRGSTWLPLPSAKVGDALQTRATWDLIRQTEVEFGVQVMRDGIAVAQSAPVSGPIGVRELRAEGQKGVYREGQTMRLTASLQPPMDGITYRWVSFDAQGRQTVRKEGTGPEAMTLELPMTLELNGRQISLYAFVGDLVGGTVLASYWDTRLSVVSADSPQLFVFNHLADHYHQATPIDLILGTNPDPAEGDTITWEWKWPGLDWEPLPGASGLSHQLTAEQALDGLQVRATLDFAEQEVESLVAGPVTIHNDDHGAPARQQPMIAGLTNVIAGNVVTLTRELPANSSTILNTHRWERRAAGASEFSVIPGTTNATLNFAATLADNGAQYRVSILKPDGAVAYGPSPVFGITVRPPVSFLVHRIGLTNSDSATANKINDQGQIAGTVDGPDGVSRGYLFDSATGQEIERAGYGASAFTEWYGINSAGVLAGVYADPADPTFSTYRAFVRDGAGIFKDIGWSEDPGFNFSVEINDLGQVAGGSSTKAWVWNPDGTHHVIATPGFETATTWGLNNHGKVVGVAWPGFFNTANGFIYDLNTRIFTVWNYPGAALTSLYGINNRGDIVGEFTPNLTSSGIPFVRWADGSTQILEFPGLSGARVYDINDDRTVVGRYKDAANKNRSFYATPNAFAAAKAYTLGHGDIRPVYTNGTLHLIYNLSVGAVVDGVEVGTFEERERGVDFAPTELRTVIPNVPLERPEEDLWDFLGTTAGQPVWLIPEVSEPDRPWLGFSTESLTRSDWQDGLLQLELVSFSGPPGGHFALFQNDGITNFVHFQTVDGVDTNDVYRTQGLTGPGFPAQIHAHANWTFSRPGSYQVGLRFSGQHLTDGNKEATAVFLIEVVRPEPTLSLARADDGSVTLGFPTEAGANYVLQRRDPLEASAWSEVEFISGTGQVVQRPVSTSKTSGFYRVIIE